MHIFGQLTFAKKTCVPFHPREKGEKSLLKNHSVTR